MLVDLILLVLAVSTVATLIQYRVHFGEWF